MAGILVMGVALGLQESSKKLKGKLDERKAKKAALASLTNSATSVREANYLDRLPKPSRLWSRPLLAPRVAMLLVGSPGWSGRATR
jgi:hypothetical protein